MLWARCTVALWRCACVALCLLLRGARCQEIDNELCLLSYNLIESMGGVSLWGEPCRLAPACCCPPQWRAARIKAPGFRRAASLRAAPHLEPRRSTHP
jgi:hypothetical protein